MSDRETPHRVPILPYDFNMPPMADGRYWVSLRWSLWPLRIGEHVRFGSAADGCEAYGRVVGLSDKGVLVELDEWIAA